MFTRGKRGESRNTELYSGIEMHSDSLLLPVIASIVGISRLQSTLQTGIRIVTWLGDNCDVIKLHL